jgi:hypothetical protein
VSAIGTDDTPPQPYGWELAAGGALCWVLVAVILVPAGQGAAAFLTGAGWCWPTQAGLFPAIGGLFSGHPGRGLTPTAAARLPAAWAVYGVIGGADLGWLVLSGVGVWVWQREFADTRGWASRRDAADALGLDRLHRRRAEIRPDLYPAKKHRKAKV